MSRQPTCVGSDLCDELHGSAHTSFALTYQGDPPTRVVAATTNLRVIADLSPLMLGHLLVLPLEHVVSFGHVITRLGTEIDGLLARLLPKYTNSFGGYSIIEHGSSSTMDMTCISHAHWHVVPVAGADVRELMRRDGLSETTIETSQGLAALAEADDPYLYCYDGSAHTICRDTRTTRRQYLRSVVGEIIGIPDPLWDYALVVRTDLLRKTMVIASRWNLLPSETILENH